MVTDCAKYSNWHCWLDQWRRQVRHSSLVARILISSHWLLTFSFFLGVNISLHLPLDLSQLIRATNFLINFVCSSQTYVNSWPFCDNQTLDYFIAYVFIEFDVALCDREIIFFLCLQQSVLTAEGNGIRLKTRRGKTLGSDRHRSWYDLWGVRWKASEKMDTLLFPRGDDNKIGFNFGFDLRIGFTWNYINRLAPCSSY